MYPDIPKEPLNLTPSQQLQLFEVGDKVFVRNDASKYFTDITDLMYDMIEKWVTIVEIKTIEETYGGNSSYIPVEHNKNDLLITCKLEQSNYTFWWYYKCLYTDKKIEPNYKSKNKANRSINEGSIHPNYKWNYIFIKFNNKKEYDDAFNKLNMFNDSISHMYFNHIQLLEEGPIYIRYSMYGDTLVYAGYSLLSDLDGIYNKGSYEKIFDYNDVKMGLLEQIKNKGVYIVKPSYEPKGKIIRESKILENQENRKLFHKDYSYNCIVINVRYKKDAIFLSQYLIDKYNMDKLEYFLLDYPYNEIYNKYLRLYINNYNKLDYSKGDIDVLERSSKTLNFTYDNVYTVDDVKNGLIENILKFGIPFLPSYKPKNKIIRESYKRKYYDYVCIYAKNHNEVIDIQQQLFKNGYGWGDNCVKSLKYNDSHINSLIYCIDKSDVLYILNGSNDKEENFYELVNVHKLYPHLFKYEELDKYISLLKLGISSPSYEPKQKIIRENINNYPYDYIIIELKDLNDYKNFTENIKKTFLSRDDNYSFIISKLVNEPIFLSFKIKNNKIIFDGWSRMTYLPNFISDFNGNYERIFTPLDVQNGLFNKIINTGKYVNEPNYEPKSKVIRENFNIDYPYDTVVIGIYNKKDLDDFMKYSPNARFKEYIYECIIDDINNIDYYIRFSFNNDNELSLDYASISFLNSNRIRFKYEKVFTVEDLKNGLLDNIIKYGTSTLIPNYKPKQKIVREDMITKLNDFLLEKSSLTALGVPNEVMKSIQSDLAIPSDAKWNRIRLKKDIINIIDNEKTLIIQIGLDAIDVLVSYGEQQNKQYFIDSYVLEEDTDWGGGYNKLPRKNVSKNQFLITIEPKKMLYHLQDDFSIKKEHHRKILKKEKSFDEFTNNFKKDFLKNFDSILRRIVGQNFKDAKDDVLDKARKIEIENKMMISGLDNPLKGANSLTILDEMIYQFEDEYSNYFDERLDIQEMSELFTRDKVMTAFMYFIYVGRIMN